LHPHSYYLLLDYFNDNVLEWGSFVLIDAFVVQLVYDLFKTENRLNFSKEGWLVVDSMIEIFLGVVFIFGYIWLISGEYNIPLKIACFIPIIVILCVSKYHHEETQFLLGFRAKGFLKSLGFHFVFAVPFIFIWYMIWSKFFPVDCRFYLHGEFWSNIIYFMATGFIYIYLLLAFFYMRYKNIFSNTTIAIVLSTLTCTAIFFPNHPLMIYCFVTSLVLCIFYSVRPNLYSATLFSGILFLFYAFVLLGYYDIGPDSDSGRWSSINPVMSCISKIQGICPFKGDLYFSKHCKTVRIGRSNKLSVMGSVELNDKNAELKSIFIVFSGKEYPIEADALRKLIFSQTIRFKENLRIRKYKMYLKVCVKSGNEIANFISDKVWVSVQ